MQENHSGYRCYYNQGDVFQVAQRPSRRQMQSRRPLEQARSASAPNLCTEFPREDATHSHDPPNEDLKAGYYMIPSRKDQLIQPSNPEFSGDDSVPDLIDLQEESQPPPVPSKESHLPYYFGAQQEAEPARTCTHSILHLQGQAGKTSYNSSIGHCPPRRDHTHQH